MAKIIEERVKAIQDILVNGYQAGTSMSNATKGNEREFFINSVLSSFFPKQYRFGTGDIVDNQNTTTGQLDVVMEFPLIPSVPIFGEQSPRLYLSAGVAAVIEVKSDLSDQWKQVLASAKKVKSLKRDLEMVAGYTSPMCDKIPFLAVGFSGWSNSNTLLSKIKNSDVDAALVLKTNCFASLETSDASPALQEKINAGDEVALWEFVKYLYVVIGSGAMIAHDINGY